MMGRDFDRDDLVAFDLCMSGMAPDAAMRWVAELRAKDAENERLRAALHQIKDNCGSAATVIHAIADAALKWGGQTATG